MNLTFSTEAVGPAGVSTDAGALLLRAVADTTGGGVRLAFHEHDWSQHQCLVFHLRANGAHRLRFRISHGRGVWGFYLIPRPGLSVQVAVNFRDLLDRPHNMNQPGYLSFGGEPDPVDLHDVQTLEILFNQVSPLDKTLTLSDWTLSAEPVEPAVLDPLVVVDSWGQWTGERGEPRTEEQIRALWAAEPTAFGGFPGQTEITGADAANRLREGSGFFRVAETDGRWWLVDPEGYRFLSVGCDCVSASSQGPVGGCEALFADLSMARAANGKGGGVWNNARWADFYQQNILRRYPETGLTGWCEQTITRLRSWGFNTVANWSDRFLTDQQGMPYVTNIGSLSGLCAHLPDVYAPDFAEKVRVLVEPEVAYVDGSIQFSYSGVTPTSAVVGIAPGSAAPGTSMVSFHNDTSAEYAAAVAERFGGTQEIDIVTVAQRFYETHDDAYDYLVIYNNVHVAAMTGALAYESTVRSSATGYSVPLADYGPQYGSAARLRSVMNMGKLEDYPLDVNALVTVRAAAQDTPLTVLGHESGHLFLAYASIPDPNNPNAKPMIGYGGAHWSFVFNSEASLDEGEQITESSTGHFVTAKVSQGFAPLDRYLMGLAPSTEVPDTFVVLHPSVSPLGHPASGVAFTGDRLNISVNDVIQAVGRRIPDYTVAQHRFRFGFILLVPEGAQDSVIAPNVQQVETYSHQFAEAYTRFSANLGTADTTLNRGMHLSLFPAAGVVEGGSATATLTLQTPPRTDLAVQLASRAGLAQVPAQVTIAAGATSASFTVVGKKAGVEELLATPADSSYETAFARVQVAAAAQLTLRAVSGDNQVPNSTGALPAPVVVRLTDANGLPYPGALIQAAAAGGKVTPATATADASGQASFQWTPGAGSVNQLNLSLVAAPTVSLTLMAGSAVPVISAVVNAASYVAGVAPGSLATLFGINLSTASVLLNGVDVRPFYASDTQVNFYIPALTPLGPNAITVSVPSGLQVSSTINLVAVQPGIFTGAVLHANTTVSALTTPVRAGDYIEIYCTGLGPTRISGGFSRTTLQPTVYIGATPVSAAYSGLAPGFVGLYQVDVQIPAGLASGTLPLEITSGGTYSNTVNIAVQ